MKKFAKWIGIMLAGLLGIIIIAVVGLSISANSRLNKVYDVEPETIPISGDQSTIERGKYVYAFSCAGCHGDDLSGTRFFENSAIGYFPAPNLTGGQGGIGGTYSDTDFMRAIRHGIGAEGNPLLVMPSKAYWYFSDEDLGAVIAFIKSADPVDHVLEEKQLKLLGKVLISVGAFGEIFAAEVLDHEALPPPAPERGVTVEYGEYLAYTGDCHACHGADLAGGQSAEPGAPFSPNLTPSGVLSIWTADEFIETMQTGVTPYGRKLDGNFMPYKAFARMTDDDLTAMFMYLQSLPAKETTSK
jgi:mono/diheme cytochrome c family protein